MEKKRKNRRPPIGKGLVKFRFPTVKERTLENGLTVLIIERGDLPKVYLRLGMNFGTKFDPPDKIGLFQLLTTVLKKGTLRRDYSEIVGTVDEIGGDLEAAVNDDFCFVYGEFLKEHLQVGIDLLSDVALNPVFPEMEVEKEKLKMIADIENEKSSPEMLAHKRFDRAIYSPHPYAFHKTVESLEAVVPPDLSRFRKKYFSPHLSYLVMAGDITESEAMDYVRKYFGSWQKTEATFPRFPAPAGTTERVVHLIHRPGSEQVNLLLGNLLFNRKHPDFIPMLVMNKILGGGGSGRLFMHLREEKGYTYGAYSALQTNKEHGAWFATAEVRPEVTVESLEAFFEQFRKIKFEPVSDEELQSARRYLMGIFPLQNETPSSVAALALKQYLNELSPGYWEQYLKQIGQVTVAEVRRVADTYIRDQQMCIVVVGDAEKLENLLRRFGKVQIYDTEDRLVIKSGEGTSNPNSSIVNMKPKQTR